FWIRRRTTRSTPCPYTTLFRSVAGAESRVMESQTGGNRMAEERMNRPEESTGESSSPITFDKLKEDLVQVVQDLTVLLKESVGEDRKSTRLNSSHVKNSYAVFC